MKIRGLKIMGTYLGYMGVVYGITYLFYHYLGVLSVIPAIILAAVIGWRILTTPLVHNEQ